eukprot:CAMPEP_0202880154 /NCGR_PEP_ID=MMETSP1391-20130828/34679_1 /ASSEMBLY_ACC=CAM_ASM_000867 /TAXON_ID=1034604 /ORGANISM="Chlamydomonas leiostraca, Strain SAG 11-49" /LENGTH=350 /DNA_ID=CAMNT_0049562613 /DNA_START=533 /DNA_END=1583 /DNA_ORIENTATION=+
MTPLSIHWSYQLLYSAAAAPHTAGSTPTLGHAACWPPANASQPAGKQWPLDTLGCSCSNSASNKHTRKSAPPVPQRARQRGMSTACTQGQAVASNPAGLLQARPGLIGPTTTKIPSCRSTASQCQHAAYSWQAQLCCKGSSQLPSHLLTQALASTAPAKAPPALSLRSLRCISPLTWPTAVLWQAAIALQGAHFGRQAHAGRTDAPSAGPQARVPTASPTTVAGATPAMTAPPNCLKQNTLPTQLARWANPPGKWTNVCLPVCTTNASAHPTHAQLNFEACSSSVIAIGTLSVLLVATSNACVVNPSISASEALPSACAHAECWATPISEPPPHWLLNAASNSKHALYFP